MESVCLFSQRKARNNARMSSRERPGGLCVQVHAFVQTQLQRIHHIIEQHTYIQYTNTTPQDTTTPSSGWSFGSTNAPSVM